MAINLGDVAANFGKGLFAGLAGTAAMTASSILEMRLSDRGESTTPAEAAEAVLDVEPEEEDTESRFSNLVHWGYGTGWGSAQGLLASAGFSGPTATAAHLALVWGSEQIVLPTLNVSAPVFKYGSKATATDLLHHTVYAYLDKTQGR